MIMTELSKSETPKIHYTNALAEYYCECLKWVHLSSVTLSSFYASVAPRPPATSLVMSQSWPDLEDCDKCGGTGILPVPTQELNLQVTAELQVERAKELGKIRDELRRGK